MSTTSLGTLAAIDRVEGDYAQALEMQLRALAIREAALGPAHLLVANTLSNIALVHRGSGDLVQAQIYYERALSRVIEAILDGRRGSELWTVLAEGLEFPEDTSAPLRENIETYVLYCFEPALAPQPYRYTRDYTTRKMTVAKSLLRIGWREPKRHGLISLNRILFGMNSLLAALEAEAGWRPMLRELSLRAG